MSGHVWSWVAGFGWTLMPYAPFRFERVEGQPRSVRARHFSADGPREATVTIAENGEAVWELGPGTEDLKQVLDLMPGEGYGFWSTAGAYPWRIETSGLMVASWPEEFALESTVTAPPPFDLVGPDDARIWIQGPLPVRNLPLLEQMAAPGQVVKQVLPSTAGPVVQLEYEHEGAPWTQFHCRADRNPAPPSGLLERLRHRIHPSYVCMVSGQALTAHSELLRDALIEVADSLTPWSLSR